jgi:hypothetical protein
VPLDKLKPPMPWLLPLGPPSNEISPVGVPTPDCGFTVTLKFTNCPCVIVVGVRLFSVVVEGREVTELHCVTRLFAFTEPKPVARSYPVAALYPGRIPYWYPDDVVQSGLPAAQGMAFVPEVTSLKMQVLAGLALALQLASDCFAASL